MATENLQTEKRAEEMFERFHDRPPRRRVPMQFGWPSKLQEIGQGRAIMYRSNKWQSNLRKFEDYKHVAEAWNTIYVEPGFLRDWWRPAKKLIVYGPAVKLLPPLPEHFAILAPLLGVQVRLYDKDLEITKGDERLYEVSVARGMLGGTEHPKTGEAMLFVYSKAGIHMLITGPKLAVEKDGIAG